MMIILLSRLLMLLVLDFCPAEAEDGGRVPNITNNSFACTNGAVIQQSRRCDGWNDCGNWDDECDCDESPSTLCQSQKCVISNEQIRRRQMCDGIFDCSDLSDECLCDRETRENQYTYVICQELLKNRSDHCEIGYLFCYTADKTREMCVPLRQLCDGKEDCADGSDENFCGFRQKGPRDGNRRLNDSVISAEKRKHVCSLDGKKGYYNQFNETCCTEQFKCASEESSNDCSAKDITSSLIDWRQMFDGIPDCPDLSDEWHPHFVYCSPNINITDDVQSRCHEEGRRLMESPKYVFKSRVFPVLEWIIASATMISNGSLIYITLKSLLYGKKRTAWRAKRSHQIMILSLSTSDFLLGVQIVFNAMSDAVMRGVYWKQEIDWKSGGFCLLIGSIAMLLTQASVITIVLISTIRLSSVMRPFKEIRLKLVAFAAICAWFFSSLIMSLPLLTFIPPLEKFFTSAVSLPTLPQVDQTVLERNMLEILMTKISHLNDLYHGLDVQNYNFEDMRWREMEQHMKDINPDFSEWKYFSLYSHSSTCFPPIVVTTRDHAWKFAVTALCADFLAYIFVIISYAIVCIRTVHTQAPKNVGIQQPRLKTRDRMKLRRQKEDAKFQKRIFLIVATDCVCWIPMCIMTFVNVIYPESGVKSLVSLSACFILVQLNSMVNPFLYSKAHRGFLQKLCSKIFRFRRTNKPKISEKNTASNCEKYDSSYSSNQFLAQETIGRSFSANSSPRKQRSSQTAR